MEGKEPRTKLVCNLALSEMFVIPGEKGIWKKTLLSRTIGGKKMYACKQIEERWLPGSQRVELFTEEAEE